MLKELGFEKTAFLGPLARAGAKILPYALKGSKAMRRWGGRPVSKKIVTKSLKEARGLANISKVKPKGMIRSGIGEFGYNLETALNSPKAFARNIWTRTGTRTKGNLKRVTKSGKDYTYKSRFFGIQKKVLGFDRTGRAVIENSKLRRAGAVAMSGPVFGAMELLPSTDAKGNYNSLPKRMGAATAQTAAWTLAPGLASTAMLARMGFGAAKGITKAVKNNKQINNNVYY